LIQVQIAWPAASGAYRQLAGQGRFRSGGKCSRFLMPDAHPLDPVPQPDRIRDAVQRIARHAIDALHTGGGENLHKQFRNFLCQFFPESSDGSAGRLDATPSNWLPEAPSFW